MAEAQALVDRIWEDTSFHSAPRFILEHRDFKNLVCLAPRVQLTPILLEMLWDDPNWILLHALRRLHDIEGPAIPDEDRGRFHELCGHWVSWGVARGYLGSVDDPG